MKSRILIKIGGRAFEGEEGFKELAEAITQNLEAEVIIVHGGGAEISQALKAAGRETIASGVTSLFNSQSKVKVTTRPLIATAPKSCVEDR